ncbi:MAG: matrixin family metalloprotease [Gemmatimonadales bacterium]
MRRFLIPVVGIAAAAALAACHDAGISQCFEPNAAAYPVYLPGDTSVVFRWPDSYRPVRIYAEPVDSLQANAQLGMQLWTNGVRCGELSLQLWPDSATADIIMRNPANMPPPPTAAAFRVPGDSAHACIGRTDIYLDSTRKVLLRPIRSYVVPLIAASADIYSCYHFVTAHEIGHALGLLSESPDAGDIMFVTPHATVLSTDDRYTIELLYHLNAPVTPSPR